MTKTDSRRYKGGRMATKPIPCRFCGSADDQFIALKDAWFSIGKRGALKQHAVGYAVACYCCYAQGPQCATAASARREWNKAAP